MTIVLITAISALAVVLIAIRLRTVPYRVQSLSDMALHSKPVDLESFRNLIDPAEEAFLRSRMPRASFRRIQRARMVVALRYVRCTAHNAALLMQLADVLRRSPDVEVARSGIRLANSAIQLRWYSIISMFIFGTRILFPILPLRTSLVLGSYLRARDCVASLTRIQQPASVAQFEAAL